MPRKKHTEGQIALVVKELENEAKVEEPWLGKSNESWVIRVCKFLKL